LGETGGRSFRLAHEAGGFTVATMMSSEEKTAALRAIAEINERLSGK
jgi:hypothetical protein